MERIETIEDRRRSSIIMPRRLSDNTRRPRRRSSTQIDEHLEAGHMKPIHSSPRIIRARSKTLSGGALLPVTSPLPRSPLFGETMILPKGPVRQATIISQEEGPRSPFAGALSLSLGPPNELHMLWDNLDTTRKGFLSYEEVGNLLAELGVEMDDWKEMEFYHLIDTDRNGKITFAEFAAAFMKFKTSGQFKTVWSSVRLACSLAARSGVTAEQVVKVWQRYDKESDEELGAEEVMQLLSDLGLEHTLAEVEEVVKEFDVDNSGKLSFQEFVSMFTGRTQLTDDEHRFDSWMNEVRTVIASRQMHSRSVYKTKEQVYVENAEERKLWYEKTYVYLLFFYAMFNFLVPLFLICLNRLPLPLASAPPIIYVMLGTDIIAYWWVYINFHLPKENNGAPVYDPPSIRKLYLNSRFAFDFLIILPFELVVGIVWQGGFLHPVFRLNKLLLVWYMNGWFGLCFNRFLGPTWGRIVNALYWWAMMAHVVACVFNVVAIYAGDEDTKIVLTVSGYSELSIQHRYLQACSYSVNTMAGLSRGVFPQNDVQAVFALFVVIIGVFVYALVLAVVSYGLSVNTQEAKFRAIVDEVKDVLSSEVNAGRLSSSFVQEAVAYHKHVFTSTGLFHIDEDLLYDLPPQLSVSIALVVGKQTIGRVPIFSSVCSSGNEEFIYALQQCLRLVVSPPNYDIIEKGAEGREMYFITSGCCYVMNELDNVVHVLKPGDMFGEIALLASVPRTATIRAAVFCNLLELQRDDFDLVMGSFPSLLKSIESQARDRIRVIRRSTLRRKTMEGLDSGSPLGSEPQTTVERTSISPSMNSASSGKSSSSSGDSEGDLLDWIRRNSKRMVSTNSGVMKKGHWGSQRKKASLRRVSVRSNTDSAADNASPRGSVFSTLLSTVGSPEDDSLLVPFPVDATNPVRRVTLAQQEPSPSDDVGTSWPTVAGPMHPEPVRAQPDLQSRKHLSSLTNQLDPID
eukprot:TRINITY_DN17420_c0_g1_i1.p1 TRINITY_DN17420_c0_g1~~TRINITY_DN17420_c0_g1_i1.p1  ORF type:complete len:1056 (+),score=189.19 TRINITY_DN17420_c0_g1_i1:268-3168(+)